MREAAKETAGQPFRGMRKRRRAAEHEQRRDCCELRRVHDTPLAHAPFRTRTGDRQGRYHPVGVPSPNRRKP